MSTTARTERTAPPISYDQAMCMSVTQHWTVNDCPIDVFQELIEIAVSTAKNPIACERDLAQHNFTERVDRWHALLVLMEHHAELPKFINP